MSLVTNTIMSSDFLSIIVFLYICDYATIASQLHIIYMTSLNPYYGSCMYAHLCDKILY